MSNKQCNDTENLKRSSDTQRPVQLDVVQLQAMLSKERQITAFLDESYTEKARIISEARAKINEISASPIFKLANFAYRFQHQGLSKDKNQRKNFFQWLLRKTSHAEDAHQYNPLMQAVDILDGKHSHLLTPEYNPIDDHNTPDHIEGPADIIVLGIINYVSRHQRPQHFAQRLSKRGHRVFYVNPEVAADYLQEQIEENLWQITLNGYGHLSIASTDWRDTPDKLEQQFDRLISENRIQNGAVIVDYPNWIYAARYMRQNYGFPTITDYMDDYTGFYNPFEALVRKNCHLLLQESNLVAASSQFLYDIAALYNNNVVMIRNGTEFAYFHQAAGRQPEKARKVIGYYGAISSWFGADMVCYCARQFPDCDVVLVGEVSYYKAQLEAEPNIRLVGEVPYTQLLPWLEQFDVCLIPFDTSTDLIKATNPVKFYEYLSAGKKIVATEIPELEPYRNRFAYLENDPDKFCAAVRACLAGTDVLASPEECFAFARENDWDARTDALMGEIGKVVCV